MSEQKDNNKEENIENEVIYDSFQMEDMAYNTLLTNKYKKRGPYISSDPKKITAFIPGKIKKIYVKKNSRVKEGDRLLVLEAMKMNNNIFSPIKATVKEVYVTQGMSVAKGALLVEFK